MSDTVYGATFSNLISLCTQIVDFFSSFFDLLASDAWTLISNAPLPGWLVTALDVANVDAALSQFSLFGLLFSMYVVYILIAYFFIP